MATVVIIILLLLVGTKIDIEEARHYGAGGRTAANSERTGSGIYAKHS